MTPGKPRAPAKHPCPMSPRGHSWGGRIRAILPGADPATRICSKCGREGRVNAMGVIVVLETTHQRTAS